MRYLLLAFFFVASVAGAAEYHFHNWSGEPYTNGVWVLPQGDSTIPLSADTESLLSFVPVDGAHSVDVFVDGSGGVTVVQGEQEESHWFWWGCLVGLATGASGFILRLVRAIGRTAPEV